MTAAYLNRIGTAVPHFDVHGTFVDFAATLLPSERHRALFDRMVERGQIEHRFSPLRPRLAPEGFDLPDTIEAESFYRRGDFPTTAERMRVYERAAPNLALRAVDGLALSAGERGGITHLVVASCTGFSAPGLDLQLVERFGLDPSVERTIVGFMGCFAGITALRTARHIVRSEREARVLIVALELCSLHMQETEDLEQILSFLLFGDGCAAALVSADPTGLALERFRTLLAPEDPGLITWNIGDSGFRMVLSGKVPAALGRTLQAKAGELLGNRGPDDVALWAVHPGGRTVLDAVEHAFGLSAPVLAVSRKVLRDYGNMSSATILFVLAEILAEGAEGPGLAMAFGPGITMETMHFRKVH